VTHFWTSVVITGRPVRLRYLTANQCRKALGGYEVLVRNGVIDWEPALDAWEAECGAMTIGLAGEAPRRLGNAYRDFRADKFDRDFPGYQPENPWRYGP
jgi:hypothetical protein